MTAHHTPAFLRICLSACRILSHINTSLHYCIIAVHLLHVSPYIFNAPNGLYKNLHCTWNSRFVKRLISFLVRSPLQKMVLKLVNFNVPLPPGGCIIVTCHTPWKRLLVQWCLKNNQVLIMAYGKWKSKKSVIQREGKGLCELRELAYHISMGGRIIVTADSFNQLQDCPAVFLGKNCNISTFPARLAKLANVPLIVALPFLDKNSVSFITCPSISPIELLNKKPCIVMQSICCFLESEVKKNTTILQRFIE